MQNRIPPPVWMLLFAVAMWFVAKSEFAYPVEIPYSWAIIATMIAVGASYAVPAVRQFGKAETTVNPLKPEDASSLVTTGVFSRSRNPMYVGLLMVLAAWATWLGSAANFALLILFVLVITALQISPEERALRELFGEEYEDYCRNVRRWI